MAAASLIVYYPAIAFHLLNKIYRMRGIHSVPTRSLKVLKISYDCSLCPAYCCTYPQIGISRRDIARIAKRFELDVETATKRFTKLNDEGKMILKHRPDPIFNTACRFL